MTKLQLELVAETYNQISKGLIPTLKINQAYQYINPMIGMEVPIRAKILAINRFMLLQYEDVVKEMKKAEALEAEVKEMEAITDSMGTFENKNRQSHSEKTDNGDNQDIRGFLTVYEKEELKSDESGTVLEVVSAEGKKTRTRTPKKKETKHTKVVINRK